MRTETKNWGAAVLVLLSGPLAAQDIETESIDGEIGVSLVKTTGNSETTTAVGRIDFTWEQPRWRQHLELRALKAEESDVASAEQYFAAGKLDYKFAEHRYLYALGEYEDNRFTGYDYRASGSLGYGHRLIDTETMILDLEAGPGYRYSEARLPGVEDGEEATFRVAGHYVWAFSESARFEQDLETSVGEDTTITKSTTAVVSNLISRLSVKVSYDVRHITDTAPNVEAVDTQLTVGVVYGF